MLHLGGNAVDAAVAAAITLCVVEPLSTGVGGDATAMVWDGEQMAGLNASGRSPVGLVTDAFLEEGRVPLGGWGSVTVPGAVSGWVALAERFGALDFAQLFAPAVRYATGGFAVMPVAARNWQMISRWFGGFPEFRKVFLPDGHAPSAGETVRLPELGETLREIARTVGASFYTGRLAERIHACAAADGAAMTMADLAEHVPEWVSPIRMPHGGCDVYELPPNCQGPPVLQALGILERLPAAEPGDTPDAELHIQIEAMRVAMTDARRELADPAAMRMKVDDLLAGDRLDAMAEMIDPGRCRDHGYRAPHDAGTVCIAAADADGRMVSMIQSLYSGSGIVVPGTGILLHNRGAAFVADVDHPNCVAPGKRPFNTNIPAFVTRAGQPVLAFGIMGGAMQPQGHVQLIRRLLGEECNPQAAVDAPRWRIETGRGLALEPGFADETRRMLTERGHTIVAADIGGFGAAQVIQRTAGGYLAAADARRDGQAAGF